MVACARSAAAARSACSGSVCCSPLLPAPRAGVKKHLVCWMLGASAWTQFPAVASFCTVPTCRALLGQWRGRYSPAEVAEKVKHFFK